LEDVALRDAESVVVCSSALAVSRGERRPVTVIANAVDAEHFRRSRPRPTDMPAAPVAVYVGSLHDSRLDVDLVVDLARSRRDIHVVLVGPNSLSSRSHRRLVSEPNILLAGPRRYADVPAYLQHADVIIVPHLVNDFTESLDPIKAYECLASGTPTVATPVAGFRTLAPQVTVAPRDHVVASVASVLENGRSHAASAPVPGWEDRARAFEEILLAAAGARA
jgi:glycosyltransferase involved in cell wall biosynthesis